jgi:hypothetical protein
MSYPGQVRAAGHHPGCGGLPRRSGRPTGRSAPPGIAPAAGDRPAQWRAHRASATRQCPATHGRARRGRLAGSRRPGRQRAHEGNQQALAGNRPAPEGNRPTPVVTGHNPRQPISPPRQPSLFCQVWSSEFVIFILPGRRLGTANTVARQRARRLRPSHYWYWAVNLTADRAGLETQESRRSRRWRAAPRLGREWFICRKPTPHHGDLAMAADLRPPPFWANLSSTPRATSEARAAHPFGVNLAVTNVAG